jgi:sugar lactone lactonase YvrE
MLNDLQISPSGEWIYMCDTAIVGSLLGTASPALLVHHVPTNRTRRVLIGHPAVFPQPDLAMAVHGRDGGVWPLRLGPFSLAIGVDSLALDHRGEWLYFGPLTGSVLFRVRARFLRDDLMDDDALRSKVEPYATKPVSDGLTIDAEGNIYVSALEYSAVARIRAADRKLELVARDAARLQWPDGFSFGAGRSLYVTTSALHLKMGGADMGASGPYYVMRMDVDVDGVPGQ